MKIAVVGGTHGNEFVGVEVIKALKAIKPQSLVNNEYSLFHANPKAYELKRRYVDSDLNRAFGKNGNPRGYEKQRSEELSKEISNNFDIVIDLHTTTSNMGLTAILNNTHKLTQNVCAFLKKEYPEMKLIQEVALDEDCTHLNRLAPAGITIEFGPIANNVIKASLVQKMYEMVVKIINCDQNQDYKFEKTCFFETLKTIYYPKEKGPWYIHPDLENNDFKVLKEKQPIFINLDHEVVFLDKKDEGLYPFFINEAAYQGDKIAMILSKLVNND